MDQLFFSVDLDEGIHLSNEVDAQSTARGRCRLCHSLVISRHHSSFSTSCWNSRLTANWLDDSAVPQIVELLDGLPQLLQLNVHHNAITRATVDPIARAVAWHTALKKIMYVTG